MKEIKAPKILDVLFVCILAGSAVLLFVLSGSWEEAVTPSAAASSAAAVQEKQATPTPSSMKEEEAFLAAMEASSLRLLSRDTENNLILLRDPERSGRMELSYNERSGKVYSWLLRFPLTREPSAVDASSPASSLWNAGTRALGEMEARMEASALRRELADCIAALPGTEWVPDSVLLEWLAGAQSARTEKGLYEDGFEGIVFRAEYTEEDEEAFLLASVILPS